MKILPIKTNSKHYNIYIGNNIISKVIRLINHSNNYIFLKITNFNSSEICSGRCQVTG